MKQTMRKARRSVVAMSVGLALTGGSVLGPVAIAQAQTAPAPTPAPVTKLPPELRAFLKQIFWFDCWFSQFEPGHKVFCFDEE